MLCGSFFLHFCLFPSKRKSHESSIFDELSIQDSDALGQVDDGVDITGEVARKFRVLLSENIWFSLGDACELKCTLNAILPQCV